MAGEPLPADVVDALRRLAYLDGDRAAVVHQLTVARELAARDAALEAAQAGGRAADEAARAASSARRAREAAIQDLNAQIAKNDARLSSGKLSTEREVSAALTEGVQLRAALAATETGWLDATEEEERLAASAAAQRRRVQREEAAAAIRRQKAAAEVTAAEERVAQIDGERRAAAQRLPSEVRERYRTLFPRTGGQPFAFALTGECSNCHRSLPGAIVQMLRSHAGVPPCPGCGRLLLEH